MISLAIYDNSILICSNNKILPANDYGISSEHRGAVESGKLEKEGCAVFLLCFINVSLHNNVCIGL